MTRRRRWLLIHRINGLLLAVFIGAVGLTGSLLAWNAQLERYFAPGLFVLPAHAKSAVRADPLAVREQVARAFPWADVNTVDLSTVDSSTGPGAPLEFSLTAKSVGQHDDDAFADPYTGRVLGSRRYGDLDQGWVNFMPFVYTLHEELALGDFGVVLLGLAALLWTADCFVGLYLTFPASHRRTDPLLFHRAMAWPARWRSSWLTRWRRGGFRRLYDLHRASGLWLWIWLLVFAWTGVAFNLPAVYRPVMHLFGAGSVPAPPAHACTAGPLRDASVWRDQLAQARGAMRRQARARRFDVLSERFLSYDPAACQWTYRVRSTLDVDRIGNTQLVWIGSDLAKSIFSAPTGATTADTFTTWIEALHESQVGGLGVRIMVCLTGVVSALLAITGVWIFFRKIHRRVRVSRPA